jgi:hypothetical protein
MNTLAALRRMLAAILLIGMTGTAVELLLLQHDGDRIQLVPLVLLGAGLLAVTWQLVARSRAGVMCVRVVMVLFLAAGAAGIYYHYQANVEFQREGDPSLSGRALLWKVLEAKVPPALSPGVMVQLGLLGLAYTYRFKEE